MRIGSRQRPSVPGLKRLDGEKLREAAAHCHRNHSYCETTEHAIGTPDPTYARDDFVDEEEIAKCVAADSVWSVQ